MVSKLEKVTKTQTSLENMYPNLKDVLKLEQSAKTLKKYVQNIINSFQIFVSKLVEKYNVVSLELRYSLGKILQCYYNDAKNYIAHVWQQVVEQVVVAFVNLVTGHLASYRITRPHCAASQSGTVRLYEALFSLVHLIVPPGGRCYKLLSNKLSETKGGKIVCCSAYSLTNRPREK